MKKFFLLVLMFCVNNLLCFSQTQIEKLVFDEINKYRVENNLLELSWDNCTYKAAKNQTDYIDKTGDYSHTQKNTLFSTPDKRLNYYGCGSGYVENILIHDHLSMSQQKDFAKNLVQIWKDSDSHNKNLLMSSDWVTVGAISIGSKSACLILQP